MSARHRIRYASRRPVSGWKFCSGSSEVTRHWMEKPYTGGTSACVPRPRAVRLAPPGRFKGLADKKKTISDEDILALMSDELHQPTVIWELVGMQVVCGSMGMPTATVQMKGPDGIARIGVGVGSGPVDAAYKAVDSLVRVDADLVDYSVSSVTQ
ncbi:2-isopropylmalate synthase B, partial [Tetrabaena socialis]